MNTPINPNALSEDAAVQNPVRDDQLMSLQAESTATKESRTSSSGSDDFNVVKARGFDVSIPPQNKGPAPEQKDTQTRQPINLVEMQAALQKNQQNSVPPKIDSPQKTVEQPVEFNVPAEKAEDFYNALPQDDKAKVAKAKVIRINEIHDVSVPMSDKIIATRDEYRRIVKRKVAGEFVEVPLANSGYIATLKPAPTMAIASIIPDDIDAIGNTVPDFGKRYQFVYDHLVTTSVGQMSYNGFLNRTAHTDLEALLWGIYRASSPDTELMVTCSNSKCHKGHRHKFSPDNVVNLAMISNATKAQINRIIAARDVEGDAKIVHNEAPAVNLKTYELNPYLFVSIKTPDAQMMIERVPIAETIISRYSQTIFGILCFVKEMRVSYDEGKQWYTITDPGLICEEVYNMSDDELEILLTVTGDIADQQFDGYSFKIPGPIVCPHCGNVDPEIREDILIDHILFFRVNQIALRD